MSPDEYPEPLTWAIVETVYGPEAGGGCGGLPKARYYTDFWINQETDRIVYEFDLPEKYTSWDDTEAISYAFAMQEEVCYGTHRAAYKPLSPDINPHSPEDPLLPIYIFLDDCRETPDGSYRTYTVEQTIRVLKDLHRRGVRAQELSLDNDLGFDPALRKPLQEGHKVLLWMLEFLSENPDYRVPTHIFAHTSNPVARRRMLSDIEQIRKLEESS